MDNNTKRNGYQQAYFTTAKIVKHSKNPDIKSAIASVRPTKATKILVVEDNNLNQIVAKTLLEIEGYTVDIAKNGQEALALFNNSYTAILMDISLPDISGIDVAKQIRSLETEKPVPIIALTANDSFESQCQLSGMNAFLVKPLILEDVVKVLAKFIR